MEANIEEWAKVLWTIIFQSNIKSSSASFSSSSNFRNGDRYGGFGNKSDGGSFKDSYRSMDQYGEDKVDQSTLKSQKGSSHYGSKVQGALSASGSKTAKRISKPDKASSNPSESVAASSSKYEEDFDDFDPRGTSSTNIRRYGLLTLEIMKFPSNCFYSQPQVAPQKSELVERQ